MAIRFEATVQPDAPPSGFELGMALRAGTIYVRVVNSATLLHPRWASLTLGSKRCTCWDPDARLRTRSRSAAQAVEKPVHCPHDDGGPLCTRTSLSMPLPKTSRTFS